MKRMIEEKCKQAKGFSEQSRFKCKYYVFKKKEEVIVTSNELVINEKLQNHWRLVAIYYNGNQLA